MKAETRSYPLSKFVEIMKPNSIDPANKSQVDKLQQILRSSEYVAEEKIDGCHYYTIGDRFFGPRISERTGEPVEKTDNFPHLQEALLRAGFPRLILDGEIHYVGKTSQDVTPVTGALPENAIKFQEQHDWVQYRVYDILCDPLGNWLVNKPWRYRREVLEAVCEKLSKLTPYLKINPVVYDNKQQFVESVLAAGGEGGVIKHVNGLYVMGKRPMWNQMKIKQEDTDDVIIMNFAPPNRLYEGKNLLNWPYWDNGVPVTEHYAKKLIGSIIIGKYKDGELIKVGQCTGMTETQRRQFSEQPSNFIGKVISIKFMEKTNDGAYRHASFVGVHPDKNPFECKL